MGCALVVAEEARAVPVVDVDELGAGLRAFGVLDAGVHRSGRSFGGASGFDVLIDGNSAIRGVDQAQIRALRREAAFG